MTYPATDSTRSGPNVQKLLTYVADLELEVDRLRRHGDFVQDEVRGTLKRIQLLCTEAMHASDKLPPLGGINHAAHELAIVLRDLREAPGYHPAHDQVSAIAVRPLVEQVFRWQRRLAGAPQVILRLALESEHVEWFPARLRHVLDNLISNSLKYRDAEKAEAWVQVGLRTSPEGYEFHVTDNGVGLSPDDHGQLFAWFSRAAPARAADVGVGLAVVKLLVEQSGGTLTVTTAEGQGTNFTLVLPRYDIDDFLT